MISVPAVTLWVGDGKRLHFPIFFMSLPPQDILPAIPAPEPPTPPPAKPAGGGSVSWLTRLANFAFVVLCFELGAFLLVYPWMDHWTTNWFADYGPGWRNVWVNPYVRGAVSGLGLVNLGISLRAFGTLIKGLFA